MSKHGIFGNDGRLPEGQELTKINHSICLLEVTDRNQQYACQSMEYLAMKF